VSQSTQAALSPTPSPTVDFDRHPTTYRHWKLEFAPPVAWLTMDVDESGGLFEGYELKLNSYDLGVDIELADAIERIRFEHPEIRTVVFKSERDRIFCSGANIYMLGKSEHGFKINFCKFTNETRLGIEDASENSGLKFLAAVSGACAGGGYELALACDEIYLVDDGFSAVSLPEVPLLGVLPGTGGLTRVVDKRKIRRDHADFLHHRRGSPRQAGAGLGVRRRNLPHQPVPGGGREARHRAGGGFGSSRGRRGRHPRAHRAHDRRGYFSLRVRDRRARSRAPARDPDHAGARKRPAGDRRRDPRAGPHRVAAARVP